MKKRIKRGSKKKQQLKKPAKQPELVVPTVAVEQVSVEQSKPVVLVDDAQVQRVKSELVKRHPMSCLLLAAKCRDKWTISTLINATGLSHATVSHVLNGHGNPRFDTMQKLAAALNVNLSTPFEGELIDEAARVIASSASGKHLLSKLS